MQTSLTYRTNRDLFSNHYLDEHLPETEAWDEITDEDLEAAREEILNLWEREKETAPKRKEAQLEEKFIRPMFRKLGIPFEVEESVGPSQRIPDYGFFETDEAARKAFQRREEGGDFYKNAVAVADAKRWGRPLDTRGSGEHDRSFENPSYQIHVYLQDTPTRWAVLTDGKKWRLYYGPTSHRLDSYYEVDLPTILEQGDLEDFKYFYLFFRHEAFLEDATGDCFLDDVYEESNVFAEELGEDLQENIYEAIRVLSEGFIQHSGNDLDEEDLGLVHDSSLIYLYRIIFVLYAEAEGRDLLNTDNPIYEESYSLNRLKQEVAEELDSDNPKYQDWQTDIGDRLDELFELIDQGSKARNIPEEDLYIPAYNGGLFRTDPDADDSDESQFLADHDVGDTHLARVIELLTRSSNAGNGTTGEGKIFVDYSSLDVRHLGSIYEGLLEYQLNVADENLAVNDDGEYVPAGEGDEVIVKEGEVYLTTDSGERKATGSYYTPEYVVEYIVENTLGPLVEDIKKNLAGQTAHGEGGFAGEFADRVFELKILDPAMGSGHFLTSAVDYLAREIIDAQERQAAQEGVETVDEEHDINWARRQVAQRCIYGVDLNPLAVELAKVSLWLRTLAAEQPLAFLDHHLKTGNSLVGSDIETVLDNGDPSNGTEEGQLTLQQSFDRTRRQALEYVTDQFEDLLAIDNETLDDIKEMEAVYDEVRDDPLYQQLIAVANVYTAEQFGLDVPSDSYERMAKALRDDSWASVEEQDWYRSAQEMAAERHFFHWELEFPIVFFQQDGTRFDYDGFDAIIGNPPWGADISKGGKEFLLKNHSSIESKPKDTYLFFISKSTNLLKEKGRLGFITPNTWLLINSADTFRKSILSKNINIISDYGDGVFEDATVESVVLILTNEVRPNNVCKAIRYRNNKKVSEFEIETNIWTEDDYNRIILDLKPEMYDLMKKLKANHERFDDNCFIKWGIKPYQKGHGDPPQTKEIINDRLYHSDIKKGEDWKPLLTGSDVDRYLIDFPGDSYIKYGENLMYSSDQELIENEKILLQQTSDTLKACYDDNQYYPQNSLFIIHSKEIDLLYLLSLINSNLLNFVKQILNPQKGKALAEIKPSVVKQLPIKTVQEKNPNSALQDLSDIKEDYNHKLESNKCNISIETLETLNKASTADKVKRDFLSYLSNKMVEYRSQLSSLNLNLLDFLGIPSSGLPDSLQGRSIEDIQTPISGITDTPLAKTEEDYTGLRIEEVSFKDNKNLVLSVSISYKVDEDDPRETDRWDRLVEEEFETYDAMTFNGLSKAEESLLREFVPVTVEEAGGFAGFRQEATKTNSPLDRLKNLTLPDIDEVQTGLEQYMDVRERADELEEKIEKTDQLIDEIVYDLYGLTDEEIKIVEEAVQDD